MGRFHEEPIQSPCSQLRTISRPAPPFCGVTMLGLSLKRMLCSCRHFLPPDLARDRKTQPLAPPFRGLPLSKVKCLKVPCLPSFFVLGGPVWVCWFCVALFTNRRNRQHRRFCMSDVVSSSGKCGHIEKGLCGFAMLQVIKNSQTISAVRRSFMSRKTSDEIACDVIVVCT